jgi:UDPglucose 6-dehydrogenase
MAGTLLELFAVTRISIFGLGRVGLVTAVCFARKGHEVVGIDTDLNAVGKIQKAEPPFFEPRLKEYLVEAFAEGAFSVTDDASANGRSELTFVAVGTPVCEDGSIDLTHIKNTAAAIGRSIRDTTHYQLTVMKSTVTPSTARTVVRPLIERESGKTAGIGFGLCSNPEFLREGNALHEAEFPDRIVIGSEDAVAAKKLESFYEELHGEHMPPVVRTTHENAELLKYANNAFLATKISFINTIANIAERTPNADIQTIAHGIGLDKRIGPEFLKAGLGWGGPCLPKDVKALVEFSKTVNYNPELIKSVITTNEEQNGRTLQAAREVLGSLMGKRIGILGLAFKPGTDDMREAVSVPLIQELIREGASVAAYDPAALHNARKIFRNDISYSRDSQECIDGADCCIIVTDWDEFKAIAPKDFIERMRSPVVIDGRRIYDADRYTKAGIRLSAIGLGPAARSP